MNHPTLAIQHPDIALSSAEIASLDAICQRTLSAQPELSHWIRPVQLNDGLKLPFIPIRCFRLMNVSRFASRDLSSTPLTTFRSSGSTQDIRASHKLGETGWHSYQRSTVDGFHSAAYRLGIPDNIPIVSLVPPKDSWPESSLAAMIHLWKESGLDVHYVDVETNPEELKIFFQRKIQDPRFDSCIIFGTALHHLAVAHWHTHNSTGQPFLHSRQLWFFDTGGTKGRTLSVSTQFLHQQMKNWANPDASVYLLSEYGMCELSSQAYTWKTPHNEIFHCTPSLRAIALSEDLSTPCSSRELGFLAFIDQANVDSWPLIITEDIGFNVDHSCRIFQLVGRAPDATIKGCSLNVKTNFRFDLSELETSQVGDSDLALPRNRILNEDERRLFQPESLMDKLNLDIWSEGAREDLSSSMRNWNNPTAEKNLFQEAALKNETLAIVASANIPVTWLFPAAHAWLMGARAVEIYLPSVRPEDPISSFVREQIQNLAEAFNGCTKVNFIKTRENRIHIESQCDRVLVFGHDETIRSIERTLSHNKQKKPVIGLGHFRNKYVLKNADTAEHLAELCLAWMGRGCLTPLIVEIPDDWDASTSQSFIKSWMKAASDKLQRSLPHSHQSTLVQRLNFAHRHNLTELTAISKKFSLDVTILQDNRYAIAGLDFSNASTHAIENAGLGEKLLDWGGCGCITFTRKSQQPDSWKNLPQENAHPSLWEPHQGRNWKDWLLC